MRQTYCHLLFNIATLKENHQPCIQDTQKEAKKMQGPPMPPAGGTGQRTRGTVFQLFIFILIYNPFPCYGETLLALYPAVLSLQYNYSEGHAG